MSSLDVVPIPDLQAILAVKDPYLVPIVVASIAGACFLLAAVGGFWRWFGSPPPRVRVAAIVLGTVGLITAGPAIVLYDAVERQLPSKAGEAVGAYFEEYGRIVGELEKFYGIEFYKPPGIPERGDAPTDAFVQRVDRVERCWVHTVEAEGRLAVSCGTDDAATATELPAAG